MSTMKYVLRCSQESNETISNERNTALEKLFNAKNQNTLLQAITQQQQSAIHNYKTEENSLLQQKALLVSTLEEKTKADQKQKQAKKK